MYELPDVQGRPSVIWQDRGDIRAWVDIVGFRHMAFIDNAYYVSGKPADYAIVQYDAKAKVCSYCVITSLDKVLSVHDSNNVTTASLRVILHYNEILTNCDENSCWETIIPHVENALFQTSSSSPLIFNISEEHVEIEEVNYNHSLYSEKLIYVNTSNLITRYNVSIPSGWILHRLQIGQIEYTQKAIPYANFSAFDTWNQSGTGIDRQYTAVILDNVNGSYSLEADSPFGHVNSTLTKQIIKTWSPGQAISSFIFLILFIVSIAIFSIDRMRKNI